jgi:hypothetical protein
LDQLDLLAAASADELIQKTYEIVKTADQTLKALMQNQSGEQS